MFINNSPHTSSYQYTQHVFDLLLSRIPMVYGEHVMMEGV